MKKEFLHEIVTRDMPEQEKNAALVEVLSEGLRSGDIGMSRNDSTGKSWFFWTRNNDKILEVSNNL